MIRLRPLLAVPAVLLSLFLTVLPFSAQSSKPITKKGLEDSLHLGGLKSSELVRILNRRGVDFGLTPEIEQELVSAGASPEVIAAVRANYRGSAASSTQPAPSSPARAPDVPAARPAVQTPGIFVRQGSAWVALPQESTGYRSDNVFKSLGKVSVGKGKGDVTGEIAGLHSSASTHSPAIFLIRMAPGLATSDYAIVHLHPKHDNREFRIAADSLASHDEITFRTLQTSGSSVQIEVSQGAGDYAFVNRNSQPSNSGEDRQTFLYTFQITP